MFYSAHGGNGAKTGFGGAGGTIILDGPFLSYINSTMSVYNAYAYGGLAGQEVTNTAGCGTGSAGTVYLTRHDELIVTNGDRPTNR